MNKYISKLLFGSAVVLACSTSCNILDQKPQDKVGPEKYYTKADQLKSFTLNYYDGAFPGHGGWGIGIGNWDNGTDNQAGPSANGNMFLQDKWRVPSEGGIGYGRIRNINWFIENIEGKIKNNQITGSKDEINQCLGEAYALRALEFYNKLKTYGDYPILLKTITDSKADIKEMPEYSRREPRNLVARQILSDFDKAIELVRENDPTKQRLYKKLVQAYKSRVALYEATFEKYHRGSGRVPGDANWPGKDKEWNKDRTFNQDEEVNFFLDECMKSALAASDGFSLTPNNHKFNPENKEFKNWNPYYCMFASDNVKDYPEVMFWRQYSRELKKVHVVTHYLGIGSSSGWTRGLVESFLTKEGLPIYADGSSYQGDETIAKVKENRDERLQLFMFAEGDVLKPTEEPVKTFEGPSLLNEDKTRDITGYRQRKFYSYDPENDPNSEMHDQSAVVLMRLGEVYLNYIEASYLRNGNLDAKATEFWKALRTRAGVSDDLQNTIDHTDMSKEADVNRESYDWGAFSAGVPVDATLYNIRRERRCELAGEGYRMDDLKRWRAMDQVKNYQIEGINLWDKIYEYPLYSVTVREPSAPGATDSVDVVKSLFVANSSKDANISSKEVSKYIRPYQKNNINNDYYNGYTFFEAHYLSPFSYKEMQLCSPTGNVEDSYLYQNIYWPYDANGQAEK